MGGIWSNFTRQEDNNSRQIQQQIVIKEIQLIENCVYCYIDQRLETLLLPYATKSYPWDIQTDILPHFRDNPDYQSRKCYHCRKGQLKDHFSCQVIDKIFQKQTQNCQCDPSSESSEINFDQSDSEHSFPPSLTDTDVSDFSDQNSTYSEEDLMRFSDHDSTYSEEDLMINHLYDDMNT